MLADGDGEADLQLAADGDDVVGVEAAVGPHGERSGGSGIAHSADGFPQEVGGAPGGVGPSLAQPGHQHVAGSGGDGQQVGDSPAGRCSCGGAPPPWSDRRSHRWWSPDGGVQVDGQRIIARSGPSGPGPGQRLSAHPIQLPHVAPPETAQERSPVWTAP